MATPKNTNPLKLDYSKNFVLLDVDKTLINGNLYNTVLIDMLRNNSDNNFFLFTRYSGQTLDSLKNSLILSENKDVFNNAKKSLRSSVVTYLKKNTIENLSGTLPKIISIIPIIPINIKGVITPYDYVFNSECPIPGDYYKKNYQEIEEKFENLNFSDKAIIAEGLEIDLKIKELIEKEKQEETEKKKRNGEITKYDDFDITLKINMFRKLVKYILDNKPETEKKKPTFIFFDDEAQQLFSVGLVGLAMYKQINLFIQNPFQKKTQPQGFIIKDSYKFENPMGGVFKTTFNDPFDFYNSFQKIDQAILDKFCLYFLEQQIYKIILKVSPNGINLEQDELDLICTYNTNQLNLKFIFFFLIIRLNPDFKTLSIDFNQKDYDDFKKKYEPIKNTKPYELTAPEINNTVNSSNTTISNNNQNIDGKKFKKIKIKNDGWCYYNALITALYTVKNTDGEIVQLTDDYILEQSILLAKKIGLKMKEIINTENDNVTTLSSLIDIKKKRFRENIKLLTEQLKLASAPNSGSTKENTDRIANEKKQFETQFEEINTMDLDKKKQMALEEIVKTYTEKQIEGAKGPQEWPDESAWSEVFTQLYPDFGIYMYTINNNQLHRSPLEYNIHNAKYIIHLIHNIKHFDLFVLNQPNNNLHPYMEKTQKGINNNQATAVQAEATRARAAQAEAEKARLAAALFPPEINTNNKIRQIDTNAFVDLLNLEIVKKLINEPDKLNLLNYEKLNNIKTLFLYSFSEEEKKKIDDKLNEISKSNNNVAKGFNNTTVISELTDQQIIKISPDKIKELTKTQIEQLIIWKNEQIGKSHTRKLTLLKPEQIAAIDPPYILNFFQHLTNDQKKSLTKEQIQSISAENLVSVINSPSEWANLKPEQIGYLTKEQINKINDLELLKIISNNLTLEQIPFLNKQTLMYIINNLSNEQFNSLTSEQIEELSEKDINSLTNDIIKSKIKNIKTPKEVPKSTATSAATSTSTSAATSAATSKIISKHNKTVKITKTSTGTNPLTYTAEIINNSTNTNTQNGGKRNLKDNKLKQPKRTKKAKK